MNPALKLYGCLTLFILGWWFLAFQKSDLKPSHQLITSDPGPKVEIHFLSELSSFDRNTIQKALSGDTNTMIQLMAEWDLDAQIMEKHGVKGIRRLPQQLFLQGQILGRQLLNSTPEQLDRIREQVRSKKIIDDNGFTIALHQPPSRFLPQTYAAASFLLALTTPEHIVAIPQGIRNQTNLYPRSLTQQIPLDIDRYNAERLYQAKPEIAFVAHYSHPSVVQALNNQGVELFTLKAINTVKEIRNALVRIGNVVNRPLEAELLSLFIEAAMVAIDNRVQAYTTFQPNPPQRPLFLNHALHYSVPTAKTLTGQLLARMGFHIENLDEGKNEWMTPIDLEQIVNLNPDCLIIATSTEKPLYQKITQEPALANLPALQRQRLHFVDKETQFYPSQYIVLAYYDLAYAYTNPSS